MNPTFLHSLIKFNELCLESDEERRKLERQIAAEPNDTVAREKLFRMRSRTKPPRSAESLEAGVKRNLIRQGNRDLTASGNLPPEDPRWHTFARRQGVANQAVIGSHILAARLRKLEHPAEAAKQDKAIHKLKRAQKLNKALRRVGRSSEKEGEGLDPVLSGWMGNRRPEIVRARRLNDLVNRAMGYGLGYGRDGKTAPSTRIFAGRRT